MAPIIRSGKSGGTPGRRRTRLAGFTFVELMVVIAIIVILISMAIPIYNNTIRRSKEAVLHNNLFTLRSVIDNYTYDKQKAPQSLQDVVAAGYLKAIPKDPFTDSTDTWQVSMDESLMDPTQTQPGIVDVHSGSNGVASDGTAYSSW